MDMGPLAALKDSFDGFHYEVYEARWGSVFAALAALLPLEPLLRVVWDVDAFRDGRGVEERRDGATLDLGAADEAIRSDFFWAYAQMLDSIGELLGGICRWGEGCPATLHPRSFVDFRDTLGRISLSRRSAYACAHYDRAWPQRAQQARCRRCFNVSWGSPTRACSCSRPWHR